ncbi:GATOR complex protein NPRL3 [Ceratina calcarata]|uniref:GATOR complex protein NPRL3 n=1 Tax=Ceratina calcarata TaxID=156304 RepID=A0AAJ7JG66_9HYME|nr:GATOR complex protein NPRL3 [Ceratina calcarata]
MEINPLSIILVKSDSKGDRLLFRYPHVAKRKRDSNRLTKRKNPYSLIVTEDSSQSLPQPQPQPQQPQSNATNGNWTGVTDEVLSTLFAVKAELCEQKFELKVNDARFVGHPTLVPSHGPGEANNSSMLFDIVFALQAQASHSVVECYHDLSRRLGIASRHEERRCGFLTEEIKIMVSTHDEVAARSEGESDSDESPYELILQRSSLARDLKSVFGSLTTSGIINVTINKWIQVRFCLPQKVHQAHKKEFVMDPEIIDRCLNSLRPYHGLLLSVEPSDLLDSLPIDSSPALKRLIEAYSPLKSLQSLSADSDLTLAQVFQLTGHLVYWAKATVIYPLCESNVYVVSPDAAINDHHSLENFAEQFPGLRLLQVLSDFSLPTSISQKLNPLNQSLQQTQLIKIIIWLLKNHRLLQLHTYVRHMPTVHGRSSTESNEENRRLIEQQPDAESQKPASSDAASDDLSPESSIRKDSNNHQTEDDKKLLDRLCRLGYLDGGHHLEEIMYLENIRRSQLLQILDKFRDALITFECEDPAIAMFHSQFGS